jgi:hypothetical protein
MGNVACTYRRDRRRSLGAEMASVVAAADGSGEGLVMAARTDPDDARAWARARAGLAAITADRILSISASSL